MGEIILIGYLGAGAWMDGKRKQISLTYLWLGTVLALAFLWGEWNRDGLAPTDMLLRFLPGIFFLVCSRLTREQVGYGDGIVLLILGACLARSSLWIICLTSILLVGIWAGILMGIKKAGRGTRIPFLPFLWIASLMVWGYAHG